jgi:P2 family phage contractile tail tube protein
MTIPTSINNYSVWLNGNRFIGMADATLPNLALLTDELKGAGIGGTINMPVMAHYDDFETTLNFHTITRQGVELMRQDCLLIDVRAGVQHYDPSCKVQIEAWRFVMRILNKGFDLGKLEVGTKETVAVTGAVTYIKGVLNGDEIFELDKVNMIARVLGNDYATAIRQAIGIS